MSKIALTFIVIIALLPSSMGGSIGWNGEYFLISWGEVNDVSTNQRRDIDLIRLEGENLTFISLDRPVVLGGAYWAEGYWLVSYYPEPHPTSRLSKFDGDSFTVLIPEILERGIVFNGDYFLIGGEVQVDLGVWRPALLKYDGEKITELNFTGNVQSIGWNGKYFLIGANGLDEIRLVKSDGDDFIEIGRLGFRNLRHIASNEDYWLITGDRKDEIDIARLVKYDGETLQDLSRLINAATIGHVKWNGEYWLIGAGNRLFKYDGELFIDITDKELFGDGGFINRIAWNGDYWLVSTLGDETPLLLRYDGRFFDLTPKGMDAIEYGEMIWNGGYWLIEKHWLSPKGQNKYGVIKLEGDEIAELSLAEEGPRWVSVEDDRLIFVQGLWSTMHLGIFLILLIGLFFVFRRRGK